jgi:hypothetical protein
MENMKSVLILLALVVMGSVLFAQSSGSSNIQSALQNMQDTSASFLMVSIVIQFVVAAVLLGTAIIIYLKKLKGVAKKETLWLVAAVVLGLVGLLCALGAVLSLLMTFYLTPVLVQRTGPY